MELKEKLLSSYVAFENRVDINSDIHEIRSKALQNFEDLGFPTKKLEAWKYTSLNSILKQDYSLFPSKNLAIELEKKGYEEILFNFNKINTINNQTDSNLLFFASRPSHFKVMDSFFENSNLQDYKVLLPYSLRDQISTINIQMLYESIHI